jgi:hypothetical protein
MLRLGLAGLVVAAVAAAPAWGGPSWGAAANRVCTRDFAEARAYEKRIAGQATTAQVNELLALDIAAIVRLRAELAAIPRPPAQSALVDRLLQEVELQLQDAYGMQRSLRTNNIGTLQGYSQSAAKHTVQLNAYAQALGAAECALPANGAAASTGDWGVAANVVCARAFGVAQAYQNRVGNNQSSRRRASSRA